MSLPRAVFENNREEVERLLRSDADVNEKDWIGLGMTALTYAAKYGRIGLADLLFGSNADVNVKNDFGVTPLHWAFKHGHLDVALILLN